MLKIKKSFYSALKHWSITCFILFLTAHYTLAGEFKIVAVDWPYALMGVAGGIVFLMYGLKKLTTAFKMLAGDSLRIALSKLTRNRISGFFTGIAVTSIVQSSSATIAMVVSFISARLITLPQSLSVILGADVGATITVQLIAFKLNQYALIAISVGYFLKTFTKEHELTQNIGRVIMAIGLIFFGIFMVSGSMSILNDISWIQGHLSSLNNIFIGILFGIILTIIIQSSTASLAIIIAIASQDILTLSGALYLILGVNMGTCVTSFLASIGGRTDALRAASAHISFKIGGTLVTLILLPFIIDLIHYVTHTDENMASPRHIAHLHTAFNIMVALICLPFTTQISNILTKYISKRKTKDIIDLKFLDAQLLQTPALALNACRLETVHMATRVKRMIKICHEITVGGSHSDFMKIDRIEREVDVLYSSIINYLTQINKEMLSNDDGEKMLWLMGCANRLESISDLIGVELKSIGKKRLENGDNIYKSTQGYLFAMHSEIEKIFDLSSKMLEADSLDTLPKEILPKEIFKESYNKAMRHQMKRLASKNNNFNTYSLEMDIIDKYQRIYHVSRKNCQKTLEYYEGKNKQFADDLKHMEDEI